MSEVLLRRLIGALVLLFGVFVLSLLLPPPSGPKPAEPGMQRVELSVDDRIPDLNATDRIGASQPMSIEGDPDVAAPAAAVAEIGRQPDAEKPRLKLDTRLASDRDDAAPPAETPPTPAKPASKPQLKSEVQLDKPVQALKAPAKPESQSSSTASPKPNARRSPETMAESPLNSPPSNGAKPAAKPEPKAALAKPPAGGTGQWLVQAGSYADIANAREVEAKLKLIGLTATLSLVESPGGVRYRVRSGPYLTRDAADGARQRMQQNGIAATIVADGR